MRVAHVFNMANNGYHIVKALRNKGIDADLIIDSQDFGMGLPVWEEKSLDVDPYKIPFKELYTKYGVPEYVKVWHNDVIPVVDKKKQVFPNLFRRLKNSLLRQQLTIPDLYRMVKSYDILHLHPPSPIFLYLKRCCKVIHEAGWIRKLVTENSVVEKLGRKCYEDADCVVWTNPDTYPMIRTLDTRRLCFVPFVIDSEKYKPLKVEKCEDLVFFHPARQVWDVKGNHKFLQAFMQFIDAGYKARLWLIDWGWEEDVALAKRFLEVNNLERFVEWFPPFAKPELIKRYNQCDAVFDQFTLGSGGTTCFEAMSCEAPLVIHLNGWNKYCFGEMPPVENVQTVDEIFDAMVRLTSLRYRRVLGRRERLFTLKHNHPDRVAGSLITLYEGLL